MKCPSCSFDNAPAASYCGHCRLHFLSRTFFLLRLRDHLFWVLRRANAGFVSGALAWLLIPALSSVLSAEYAPFYQYLATGFLGGAFLGSVDGMVEESSPKTFKGALIGGLGGLFGGTLFQLLLPRLTADTLVWGLFCFWAVTGLFVGLVSALWEKKPWKLFAGSLAGLIGGGTGGALGYMMHANLIQSFPNAAWLTRRLFEALSGGIVGVSLWFVLALMERVFIFRRRPLSHPNAKACDHCQHQNSLSSWYCVSCGSVLQEAAPPASLPLSPFTTLDRAREMFRFLSRLSITTGAIAGVVIFSIVFPVNKILALVALVMTGVVSYCAMVCFSSIAESLHIFIRGR